MKASHDPCRTPCGRHPMQGRPIIETIYILRKQWGFFLYAACREIPTRWSPARAPCYLTVPELKLLPTREGAAAGKHQIRETEHAGPLRELAEADRKSTRLNSSH